jgi:hypothetical protein
MQDFRISLQDEGPVPMDVFERIKKDREEEAARVSVTAATGSLRETREETTITTLTQKQTQQTFAEATDVFARGSRRAEEEAEAAFAERERASLQARWRPLPRCLPLRLLRICAVYSWATERQLTEAVIATMRAFPRKSAHLALNS